MRGDDDDDDDNNGGDGANKLNIFFSLLLSQSIQI